MWFHLWSYSKQLLLFYMMTSSNGNISALLALCARNSPVTGEFPGQRPMTRSFDVFFDLHLNKRLSKQWWGWWYETPWANYDIIVIQTFNDLSHADPLQSNRVINTEKTYKLYERYLFLKMTIYFCTLFLINEIQYNEYLVNTRCLWHDPLAAGQQLLQCWECPHEFPALYGFTIIKIDQQ